METNVVSLFVSEGITSLSLKADFRTNCGEEVGAGMMLLWSINWLSDSLGSKA